MTYTKQSVQFHSDGFRDSRPAVNVKHWPHIKDVDWSQFDDAEFKHWATGVLFDYNGTDDQLRATAYEVACESAWELVQNDAEYIFESVAPWGNSSVKVWSQGRSGGWAVVDE